MIKVIVALAVLFFYSDLWAAGTQGGAVGKTSPQTIIATNPPGTSGQCLSFNTISAFTWVNCGGGGPFVNSLQGLSGALTLSSSLGLTFTNTSPTNIQINTPQDLRSTASPSFNNLSLGTLTIPTGGGKLHLESISNQLSLRDSDQSIADNGLIRFTLDAGTLNYDVNTAAAGDFSIFDRPFIVHSANFVHNTLTSYRGVASPGISGAGESKLVHNSTTNTLQASVNGGAYFDIQPVTASGWTDTGTLVRLTTASDNVRVGPTLRFEEGGNGVLGFDYPDSVFDRRLRLTAGFADTADNTQGASIDLHGNNHANAGRLDLVSGGTASMLFFTNNLLRASIDGLSGLVTMNNGLTVSGQSDLTAAPLAGAAPLSFTGLTTGDPNNTVLVVTDPTAPRTVTIPDANSVTVQPVTCPAGQAASAVSALGVVTCSTTGITSINGQSGPAITHAVGSSGTAPNIAASGNTITHNFPLAGFGVSSGMISDAPQAINGQKNFLQPPLLTGLGADRFMFLGTGAAISASLPATNGQLLIGSTGAAPTLGTPTATSPLVATLGPGTLDFSCPTCITTASGFVDDGTVVRLATNSDQVAIGSTTIPTGGGKLHLDAPSNQLSFRDTDQAITNNALARFNLNSGSLFYEVNTSAAGDFSTFLTPVIWDSGNFVHNTRVSNRSSAAPPVSALDESIYYYDGALDRLMISDNTGAYRKMVPNQDVDTTASPAFAGLTVNGPSIFNMPDNASSPFLVREGSNTYLVISTGNGSELFTFGNIATNPTYFFSGGGNFLINGNLSFLRGVSYSWPTTQGAASTTLTNDGAGNLTWSPAASPNFTEQTVTGATTLTQSGHVVLASSTGGSYTITMPAPASHLGREILISKTTSDSNDITVEGQVLQSNGSFVRFVATSIGWRLISRS